MIRIAFVLNVDKLKRALELLKIGLATYINQGHGS